jgi:hypothetical protein
MRRELAETVVAARVVEFFERSLGCDVYQEVRLDEHIVDFVALCKGEVWVVEVKNAWGCMLLEQCRARRSIAHRVFAAAPFRDSRAIRRHGPTFWEAGFGTVHANTHAPVDLIGGLPPLTGAHIDDIDRLRHRLRFEHKTHAKAGTSGEGRFTPFMATRVAILAAVQHQPGLTIREVIGAINHHYANVDSATGAISRMLNTGMLPGIRSQSDRGTLRLYPADDAMEHAQ